MDNNLAVKPNEQIENKIPWHQRLKWWQFLILSFVGLLLLLWTDWGIFAFIFIIGLIFSSVALRNSNKNNQLPSPPIPQNGWRILTRWWIMFPLIFIAYIIGHSLDNSTSGTTMTIGAIANILSIVFLVVGLNDIFFRGKKHTSFRPTK